MGKLSQEEMERIVDEVEKAVDNVTDYYLTATAGNSKWYDTYVEITVYWHSSKSGDEWEETWYVYDDGKISTENDNYDNVEQLKNDI